MLLSNPLASPVLPALVTTLGGLFVGALAVLLVAARTRPAGAGMQVLFARWRTWAVIAPVYSLVVLSGPSALAVLAALLGIQAAREYARLAKLPRLDTVLLVGVSVLLPAGFMTLGEPLLPLAALGLPLLASVPALFQGDASTGARRTAAVAFGFFYVAVGLGAMVLIAQHPSGGSGLLLALGLAVALSDIGAFVVGKWLGRRALSPSLSPGKTREGLAGNLVGAALGAALLGPFLPAGLSPVLLVALVAVGAVWGDLLESALKRGAGRKDAGDCLPGFGGLLDRIDSFLVVLPLTYLLLEVVS